MNLDSLNSKVKQEIVDFHNLEKYKHVFKGGSVVFCCLGSSLSQASKAEFEFVERELIVNCGKFFKESGITQFHLGE